MCALQRHPGVFVGTVSMGVGPGAVQCGSLEVSEGDLATDVFLQVTFLQGSLIESSILVF